MKRFLYLLLLVLVASCVCSTSSQAPAPQTPAPQTPNYRIDGWVKNWIKQHPDILKNSITKEDGIKQFDSDFRGLVENDPEIFQEFPYKFISMLEYKGGDKYAVKFEDSIADIRFPSGISIMAELPREEAAKLESGKQYRLSWDSICLAEDSGFRLPSGRKVSKNTTIWDDVLDVYHIYPDNLIASGLKFIPF